ncbi:MAG TPA: IclR family transcriptional regulator [Microbacterium sp.]|uniref:IclR family transcriptional regulator n=1 Tax=Microbacterium sp. TaxID=51671 RepID=UPI002C9ACD8B|nr:IclR family transcriptional regulator [Microbacterium sp.]HWI32428.1 IclR family transcriptional regulator [Microbacterium sp.]
MANGSDGRSTLSRHLDILAAFDIESPFLTLAEVSRRSALQLSTCHRLLSELVHHGLVERRDDKTFRLGLRLWELACRTPGALGIREIAVPHLREVHAVVGQHIQLGVLSGSEVIFLERLSTRDAVVNITTVGGRLPLHASSSGLVLLAFGERELQEQILREPMARFTHDTIASPDRLRHVLHEVRVQGFVVGNGFIHPDARGIAVPVFGSGDAVVAAISAVVPNDDEPWMGIVESLTKCAASIGGALQRAYLPASDPRAGPGGRLRRLVNSSTSSMEYLAGEGRRGKASPRT